MTVLKLYRISESKKEYWETWMDESGTFTVHWGDLGTKGNMKKIKSVFFEDAKLVITKEIDEMLAQGFARLEDEDHVRLMIEYAVNGMDTPADLDKRHRLEERVNETLGWTALGYCDGGSIGSGTMEACNFVVDFALAKSVIEADLASTEFSDYTRIYDEDQE